MSSAGARGCSGGGGGDDDDLELLRQAALKTLGTNRSRPKSGNASQGRVNTPPRIKTNGNLIEIQPLEELAASGAAGERLSSDDYTVEEFVLEGSDVSVNSSDCDEVIEEVIVSEAEDEVDAALNHNQADDSQNSRKRSSRSRSRSLSSNRSSESDAVSIKSSYSLIMDDDDTFQSVESKFLSKKNQKPKETIAESNNESSSTSRRRRSRSPPFRPRLGRRSSRSRDREGSRNTLNRKSRSRSRSPAAARRRNLSPLASSRGMRRPYRTNSIDRNQRRRRSRSPTSRSPNRRLGIPNSRRPRSRSPFEKESKSKQSSSHGPKSPPQEIPDKVEKPSKNVSSEAYISPTEMDRLEKRRRKFEGESEVVAPSKKVIKIASSGNERQPPSSSKYSSSSAESSKQTSVKSKVLKEKVQKTISKREANEDIKKDEEASSAAAPAEKTETQEEATKSVTGDEPQEDLRTRLIKKKLEKMQQTGGSGPPSSVVVSMGSQRIFSQALKNSQLLEPSAVDANTSKSTSKSIEVTTKPPKPRSEVTISRNSSNKSSSSRKMGRSGGSSSSKSSTSSTSSTKRVVSVTYS